MNWFMLKTALRDIIFAVRLAIRKIIFTISILYNLVTKTYLFKIYFVIFRGSIAFYKENSNSKTEYRKIILKL